MISLHVDTRAARLAIASAKAKLGRGSAGLPAATKSLKDALVTACTDHYRKTFVPRDTGLLAASLRVPRHPLQRATLTETGTGWRFRFRSLVSYAKYQAHRIEDPKPADIARAFIAYLTRSRS